MSWSGGIAEWEEGGTVFISVAFSWLIEKVIERKDLLEQQGYNVMVGGPHLGGEYRDAIAKHNPNATRTSFGCVNSCKFCIVPISEGPLVELDDWVPRPIVCDNNLLACSRKHFDSVIDRLKPIKRVDFNQGLDARLMTAYHADRIAELDMKVVRIAWDDTKLERQFIDAFDRLLEAGFHPRFIQVYVLIGYNDTPEDALYRLEKVRWLGSRPNPMRYQPITIHEKNSYVHPNWTDKELKRYMKYWSRLRWYSGIPFEEFQNG